MRHTKRYETNNKTGVHHLSRQIGCWYLHIFGDTNKPYRVTVKALKLLQISQRFRIMFRSKITQIVHPFSLYEIQFPSAKSKWQRESRGNFDIQQIIYMLLWNMIEANRFQWEKNQLDSFEPFHVDLWTIQSYVTILAKESHKSPLKYFSCVFFSSSLLLIKSQHHSTIGTHETNWWSQHFWLFMLSK